MSDQHGDGYEPLWPLPDDWDQCRVMAGEISNRVALALVEVGGRRTDGNWYASGWDLGRAQQLALVALGIGHSMVPLCEYRTAVLRQFPEGPRHRGRHGLACRDSWWDEAAHSQDIGTT